MHNIKRSSEFIKPYHRAFIIGVVLSILGAAMNILIPGQISKLADVIMEGISGVMDMTAIRNVTITGVVLTLLYFVFSYMQSVMLYDVSQKMTSDIRIRLSNKLDRLPLSYLDGVSSGDILSRTTNDVTLFSKAFSTNLGTIASNSVTLVGCIIVMFISSWQLAIAAILATLVGTFITTVISKYSRPLYKKSRDQMGTINAYIDEMFSGHLILKAFNCEREVSEEFDRQNEALSQSSWKAQFLSSLMTPVMIFAGNLAYVAVCVFGAYLMIRNAGVTIGTIAAFIIYVKLFGSPLSSLASVAAAMQPALVAQDRIFELLDTQEVEFLPPGQNTAAKGEVVFDHVSFGYLPGQTIIKDFSAKIEPGMKVAIVGPTGAGKTTLVNLLMRFYEVNSGNIILDGTPIKEMAVEDLHSILGMVLQETWVFEGSIRDNIIYSTQNVSEERLKEVLKSTGLDRLVEAYPDGADTVISERMELSTGQIQLITIARAMIKDPSVLILDEATSSIDTRTELLIQSAIDKLIAGRTSFVIAHRLSTIRNADVIFVMKDGDIVETGNHDELLKKGGLYSELYYSQFVGKEGNK